MFWQTHPASSEYCFVFHNKFCLTHDRHVLYLAVEDNNKDDNGGEHVDEDDTIQKEVGSTLLKVKV